MSKLLVTSSPHAKSPVTTSRIMLDVVISLVPALVAAVVIFGMRALLVVSVCVATCVISELAYEKLMKRPVTINDFSAVVTGVLLAYNLPSTIPLWQAVFGSFVAIILVKQLFGGLGKNFANPAITARIVMFLAFSATMSTFEPVGGALASAHDAVTQATPLALISGGRMNEMPPILDLFIGKRGGDLGETSTLAILIGGIYLLVRRVITWHIPVSYIAVVFGLTALLGQEPVYQVLSGGLALGAIFMATDYVTSPQTALGKLVFGVGAGLITVLIRVYGSYPEGVSFAILLMNILTPYINRFTLHRPMGGKRA